ncbi:MAG TPA: YwiC-like family protein [Polyangiaceae bacterium]
MPHSVLSVHEKRANPTNRARRSLLPKEHGAWGQLLLPLIVALGSARTPNLHAWALAAAGVALFMAHEPFVVWLGQRGTRAAREHSDRALRHMGVWGLIAAAMGGAALLDTDWWVRGAASIALTMVLVFVLAFLMRGTERSTPGELWLAFTMPAAAVPATLALGNPPISAITAWASFALAFSAGVFGVRGIIRWHKHRDASAGWAGLCTVFAASVGLTMLAPREGAAALLFWAIAVGCRLARPAPRALKRVGWCLVAGSVLQAAALLSS